MSTSASVAENKYKLIYFNGRGRAEFIRYMFHYANVPFEDHRITFADWPKVKPTTPLGQVPVLEVSSENETKRLCQCGSIVRQLADLFGFAGKNIDEASRCDEGFEIIREVGEAMMKAFWQKDPDVKQELLSKFVNDVAPRNLGYLEKRCIEAGGKNIAGGDGFTYTDLTLSCIFDFLNGWPLINYKDLIESAYPHLHSIRKAVEEVPQIKAYLDKRPKPDF